MPVGLNPPSFIPPVAGIRLASAAAGIRKPDRQDLVLLEVAPGTECAAVFTRNRFRAAPVEVALAHLAAANPRALLINTGYANAGTGEAGRRDAQACCEALAAELDCRPDEVLPFSTGVIGEPLPLPPIRAALPGLIGDLSADAWVEAARGIMTTDTVPKAASRRLEIGGRPVTVSGIAKGAGMIRPDMATMLAFVATDAGVPGGDLDTLLREAVGQSFNRISVDGDTSTNDACCLLATGATGVAASPGSEAWERLRRAVTEVCVELAQAIVRDGEGATKFITIRVEEAAGPEEARAVAGAVAHSPLVKTAFYASDPNWGRILAAVGRAGIDDLEIAGVRIALNDVVIVSRGGRDPCYTEEAGQRAMDAEEITVRIDLGRGRDRAVLWTCDLSHGYVSINAEYRT
ncbi:MAG TPA: bifunctional glutamate N-acetyltransferase/amino-acid acetyltransferase ArgJ [Gammaproteobacteria bacterium]|nr:bifunctional glutamate N-acetyltransferase/amino-acid acetyltransferase ArgJ [Gammaproteobacteria bacterium]